MYIRFIYSREYLCKIILHNDLFKLVRGTVKRKKKKIKLHPI